MNTETTIVNTFSREENRIRKELKQSTKLRGLLKYQTLKEIKIDCKNCITDIQYFLEDNDTKKIRDILNAFKKLKQDISKNKSRFMDKLKEEDDPLLYWIDDMEDRRMVEEYLKNNLK